MSAESAMRGMRKARAMAKGRPRLGLVQNEGVLSSASVAHNSIRCVVIELPKHSLLSTGDVAT